MWSRWLTMVGFMKFEFFLANLPIFSISLYISFFSGIRMGSLGLFLQCIISLFFSTIMDRIVKHFGTRMVYLASVALFPLTAFIMCFSQSVVIVTISAALTGFPFSVLQILPYTLASLYHHEKQVGETSWNGSEHEINGYNFNTKFGTCTSFSHSSLVWKQKVAHIRSSTDVFF